MAKRIRLSFMLGCGIACTTVAILRVGVWPMDTPVPGSIHKDQLQRLVDRGWMPIAMIAAQSRQRVSSGGGYRLRAPMANGGRRVQIRLIPVRARGISDLDVNVIERNLSGDSPKRAARLTIAADQFLVFPAGAGKREAATCLASGLGRSDHAGLVNVLVNSPTPWTDRLLRLVGLQQPRDLSCLFTAITFEDGPARAGDVSQVIERVWRSVGSDLKRIRF